MVRKSLNEVTLDQKRIVALVNAAARFQSLVLIGMGTKMVNAKSLIGMLSFTAQKLDGAMLMAEGSDEQEAAETIAMLINQAK